MVARESFLPRALGLGVVTLLVGGVVATLVRQPTGTTQPEVVAIAPTPRLQTNEVHASDGTMNLTVLSSLAQGGTVETLYASEISGANKRQIFQKTYPKGGIVLPPNSWSPDNNSVFVEEKIGATSTFLVMKASGEPFADGQRFIDVGALFREKLKDLKLQTITGWAAPTLLVVMTTKEDGSKGGMYWFDVDSRSFLLLRG